MQNKVLELLKKTEDYISGEEISKTLGVSRTTVWKCVNALKEKGYIILSSTNKGYKLCSSPDVLNLNDVLTTLDGYNASSVGTDIHIMHTVDSTNEEIKRLAHTNKIGGIVVAADIQTAGKGRLGRIWNSENGGLYFSFLIRPELAPSDLAAVTLAAGYAVCLAIRKLTGCNAKIKWPNDIIIGSKKVCGILTEMEAQTDRVDFVAIGIGVNVNQESFDESVQNKATSLFLETGKKMDRNIFLAKLLKTLDKALNAYFISVSVEDMEHFKSLCATIGRRVSVERGNEYVEGTAIDILPSGELIICTNDGRKIPIYSGEVSVQGIY